MSRGPKRVSAAYLIQLIHQLMGSLIDFVSFLNGLLKLLLELTVDLLAL
jgi:hypothetical protein